MANSLHVKKGDRVKVIAGKDKGLVGDIIEVLPEQGRVIVEGVNVVKKHTPDRSAQTGSKDKGGIITTEAPIDASNVQLVVKVDGSEVVTRVGYERREVTKRRPDGSEYSATRSVRIARKTGKEI
ncbi:50S ribosomal protein L24 [Micropruina sonneratiae]|uniref:50S ribosomal protein L24 n=1 Tax=Micropruina sonneratiae TaxID=2986940 RepID=UPI0022274565|nr:50S ribosomal protein L24 [Micropruina sp. KQZ13P-5]MCW3157104.1 50S ribosomal protein L24 [Micropruina sp. KQZ13P-5]